MYACVYVCIHTYVRKLMFIHIVYIVNIKAHTHAHDACVQVLHDGLRMDQMMKLAEDLGMYVCMYVRMYVCMYVCIYVCKYVSMYVWMYVYMHV